MRTNVDMAEFCLLFSNFLDQKADCLPIVAFYRERFINLKL